jgi:hypothetical protein
MRRGFDRGLLEGSRGWVIVGGLALLGHLAGRAMSRHPETLHSQRIQPGDVIQISSESRR